MKNIMIVIALLGATAIFIMMYCLVVAGSHAEKKLTEMIRKEEKTNEEK